MSRLQAPGFSKLRAPGFSKTTVPVSPSNGDTDVFKKPVVPKSHSNGEMKHPTASTKLSFNNNNNNIQQHGPGPYDRTTKVSTIPYVGKKRTTGSLKAPESRLTKNPVVPIVNNNKENCGEKQPTRRQLAMDKNTNADKSVEVKPRGSSSGLVTPRASIQKSSSASSRPVSGLMQPRQYGGLQRASSTQSILSGQRQPLTLNGKNTSVTKSMLSLSTSKIKNESNDLTNKSVSQNDLTNMSKSKLKQPANSLKKTNIQQSKLLLKGPLANVRPRVSTYNKTDENISISTPYHSAPSPSKYLETLKISPIVTDLELSDHDSTFNVFPEVHSFVRNNKTIELSPAEKFDNSNNNDRKEPETMADQTQVLETVKPSNKTFDNVVECEGRTTCNKTVSIESEESYQEPGDNVDVSNITHILHEGFNTHVLDHRAFNETRVVMPEPHNNQTQVVSSDDNELFLENETMPCLVEETTCKTYSAVDFEDMSFTEDIQKVIAAITSENPLRSTNTITLSPAKQSFNGPETTQSNVTAVVFPLSSQDTTVKRTPEKTPTSGSAPINRPKTSLSKTLSHPGSMFYSEKNAFSQVFPFSKRIRDTFHVDKKNMSESDPFDDEETSTLKESSPRPHTLSLPDDKTKTSQYVSLLSGPVTPTKDDDEAFTYEITNRCYTITAAEVGKRRAATNSRLKRSKTYSAHDFTSNFRPPRQMNMIETLEGNVLMDNTSFLHFTNDVKALKTQLLRLKRTLLEADCQSPLIKTTPIKHSNSFHVSDGLSMPPLSPRVCLSSPLAVVDPLVVSNGEPTKLPNKKQLAEIASTDSDENDVNVLIRKFNSSLHRIEELEKQSDCKSNTIKLLQIQLENYESKEQDILEENIILREELAHLTERVQRFHEINGNDQMMTSSSFDDFDLADIDSRKGILQRLYSNDGSTE